MIILKVAQTLLSSIKLLKLFKTFKTFKLFKFLFKLSKFLLKPTNHFFKVWLMCALMFDRYRTLCSPFAVRSSNISLIHRVLLSVCLVALVFSLPRFFELHLEKDPMSGIEYVSQTELVHNKLYMIGYRIFGKGFLNEIFKEYRVLVRKLDNTGCNLLNENQKIYNIAVIKIILGGLMLYSLLPYAILFVLSFKVSWILLGFWFFLI